MLQTLPQKPLSTYWERIASFALLGVIVVYFLPVLTAYYEHWLAGGGKVENRAIALVAIIYLVTQQKDLLQAPLARAGDLWIGFATLFGGLLLARVPLLNVQGLALSIALLGLLWFRWGRLGLAHLGKPLCILALALGTDGLADQFLSVYTPLVQWLQHLDALIAGYVLWGIGYPVELHATVIRIGQAGVDVYDGCSGIHSLIEIGVLAVVAILTISKQDRAANLRYFLACMAITFGFNLLRILLLAFASIYVGQEAFDALHKGWGADVYANLVGLTAIVFTARYFQWNPFAPKTDSDGV